MAKKKEKDPNLNNATPGFLVDEIGMLRTEMKALEKKEAFFKEALLARVKPGQRVEGELYYAEISSECRTGLDTQRIKEEFGEDWCAERSKTTEYTKVSTKRMAE